ncbi:MAG: GumC family protein [Acidobacteriota bacterium]
MESVSGRNLNDLVRRRSILASFGWLAREQARPTPPPRRDEISLPNLYSYLWHLLLRRWLLISSATLVLMLMTVAQLMTLTPTYRSTAKIQVSPGSGNVSPYPSPGGATWGLRGVETYVQTQKEIVRGDRLAGRVVQRLGLAEDPVFNLESHRGVLLDPIFQLFTSVHRLFKTEPSDGGAKDVELADELLKNLEVHLISGTQLLQLDYDAHDPRLAAKIVNAFAETFFESEFEARSQALERTRDALQKQLLEVKANLEASEAKWVRYARQNDILKLDENQGIALQKLVDLNRELTKVESTLMSLQAERLALNEASAENFPAGLENPTILDLEARLTTLRQKRSSLQTQFGRNWPETVRIEKQTGTVAQQLRLEKQRALDQAKQDYQVSLDHYRILSERLRKQVKSASQLDQDLIEFKMLQREVETNKSLYEGLLQRVKEAGVAVAEDSVETGLVERGRVPRQVYWPNRSQYLAISLLLGLMIGLGSALLLESSDDTLRTAEEAERLLSAPCLGVIPKLEAIPTLSGRLPPPENGGPPVEVVPVAGDGRESRHWEAYRWLRTAILQGEAARPVRVLITSALQGEGKTATAVNTAISLAQSGACTLLIDLNLRSPSIPRFFGIESGQGISQFLCAQSNLCSQVRETEMRDLFLLPAGTGAGSAVELIASPQMDRALNLLSQFFDAIVMDTPALIPNTDALILARKADQVVVVIEGGKTPRAAVEKALWHLARVKARVLGTVINNVDISRPEYLYDYGSDRPFRS